MNRALATLFAGMFVMGSTELLVVGVLDLIANDLAVSIPAAGALVTAYALGLAIGGPILTALTIRLNRRTILAAALILFVAGTAATVFTTSYVLFLVVRVLVGAGQGLFIAAAFAAGTAVVPPERAGRAMAVVISGTTVTGAVGVPLGTLAGQALGWRGSFLAATALAVVALVATLRVIPSLPGAEADATGQVRSALAPRVLALLGFTFLIFASVYAALTYIVPFLNTVTKVSGGLVSVFLLAYGVATAVGSFGGGRFADRNAARTLVVGTVGVALSLGALLVFGTHAALVALAVLATGGFAMGMAPSMQYRVTELAGPGAAFAQSLPASAANVGIAFGSFAGGVAVGAFSVETAVVAGLLIATVAVPCAYASARLKPPTTASDVTTAREPALTPA